MRIQKYILLLVFVVMSLFAFNACSGTKTQESKEPEKTESTEQVQKEPEAQEIDPDHLSGEQLKILSQNFSVSTNYDDACAFNGYGQIAKAEDIKYFPVTDIVTGELRYYSATYNKYKNIHQYPPDIKAYSRLYDPDGKIIADWQETTYGDAIGDWIVSKDYVDINTDFDAKTLKSALINVKTGKKVKGIWSLSCMDKDHVAASTMGSDIKGILNADGSIKAGFPIEVKGGYPTVCGPYLVTSIEHGDQTDYYFYDGDLNYLGRIKNADYYLSDFGMTEGMVNCGEKIIYNPAKGKGKNIKPVIETLETTYCDQKVAIIEAGDENDTGYCIYDLKKNIAISDTYETLLKDNKEGDTLNARAEYFIGIKDGKIHKLDRTGKVIAEVEAQDVHNVWAYAGGIVGCNNDYTRACLFDTDLNLIIPFGTYSDINQISEEGVKDQSIWTCSYEIMNGNGRIDIMRIDGTVIVKGASHAGMVQQGRIAVNRGLSIGLMDLDGNWVVKIPKSEIHHMD